MALLIPISVSNQAALEKALDRLAPYNWAEERKIHVFAFNDQEHSDIGSSLSEYCQNHHIQDILIPHRLHCDEDALLEAGYTVVMGPSIKRLIYGHGLQNHLRRLGLDWRSEVISRLKHYALAAVDETQIDKWLAQFERLGNHRAVGEHLLQLVEVLPLADLGASLSSDSDFYRSDLVVGFNNDKWGKSWATVSNLIYKHSASALLLPIDQAIEKGAYPSVLRLVEDGLFSGTEMRAVFDSLRGKRPPGRTQKVPKLVDPSVLSKLSTQIYFGVVCDFGEAALRRYMITNSLPNIQVALGAAAKKFRVLLGHPGVPSHNHDNIADDETAFRDQLRSRVIPFAFQDDKGWKSPDARLRAKTFCETVGEQLWRSYITKKTFDPGSWPEDRIKRCALGMEGLGLTFAFPHSVPKASLPLFWARGQVTRDGTTVPWVPLFPNADS
jgi:hypothetical protein